MDFYAILLTIDSVLCWYMWKNLWQRISFTFTNTSSNSTATPWSIDYAIVKVIIWMESFNWSNWSKRLLRFIATLSALHSDGPDWHWYILSQMVRMTHNPIRLVCHEWRVAATFAHKRIFFGSSSSRNGFYIACVPVSSIFDMLSNFNEELQSATSNALIEISPGRIPKVSFSMMIQ